MEVVNTQLKFSIRATLPGLLDPRVGVVARMGRRDALRGGRPSPPDEAALLRQGQDRRRVAQGRLGRLRLDGRTHPLRREEARNPAGAPRDPALPAATPSQSAPYAVRKPKTTGLPAQATSSKVDTLDVRPLPGVVLKYFTARDVVSRRRRKTSQRETTSLALTERGARGYTLVVGRFARAEGRGDVPKRTWQPKKRRRQRRHGFMARMHTPGGRRVLSARRLKGRRRLAV